MSGGPPPVPGGRSAEEREAARREREARRAGRDDDGDGVRPLESPPLKGSDPEPASRDWLAEAERLTEPPPPAATPARAPRTGRRRPRGRLLALAIVALAVIAVGWFANKLFQPFKGEGQGEVRVVIPQGASLGEIADLLEAEGVVDSSSFFQLRARINGRSGDLKPGPYTLAGEMAYADVLDTLEEGVPPNVVMVTIPEGRSRGEIAPHGQAAQGQLPARHAPLAAARPARLRRPGPRTLEGFLFPATYELKKGQPVRKLVDQQLSTFKQNFAKVDMSYARRKNLTRYDVLIIASLVEREAAVAKERPIIASVIYNRLKNDIRLDIDATTRFAVGNWSEPLKQSELANPSPYNTRVHPNLPPGPIGNPGLASIKAAARPAKTGFLFYVVKPKTCGRHNFAETDAEFQRYVAEYERAREAAGGKSPDTC